MARNDALPPDVLADRCNALLSTIADTTAKILMAKKRPLKPIQVSITTLRKFRKDSDTRYQVVAHSSNASKERVDYDIKIVEPERLENNAIYRYISNKHGGNGYCHFADIEGFLNEAKLFGCPEPHPFKAPKLYRSALVVPIKGPKAKMPAKDADLPDERVAEAIDDSEVLLGFVAADSLGEDVFDTDWDLEILRGAVSDAFDALSLWYSVYAAGEYSALRLVTV
jgi:hypothetical protein